MRWLVVALALMLTEASAAEWAATRLEGESLFSKATEHQSLSDINQMAAIREKNGNISIYDDSAVLFLYHSKFGQLDDEHYHELIKFLRREFIPRRPIQTKQPAVDGIVGYSYYSNPTLKYRHGVFGSYLEAQSLVVTVVTDPDEEELYYDTDRALWSIDLDQNHVFEDSHPRRVDLDGDGTAEIVTIVAKLDEGAAVSVLGIKDNRLTPLARTPYIGIPNRWLNIAGIADFDGSGSASIALVRTPHIGGTLQFWRWSTASGQPTLTKTAELFGFSNHKYGAREQRLSAVEDFDNDGVSDLALPSANRRSLKLVRLSEMENPQVEIMAEVPLPSPIDKAIGVTREGDDVVLTVGLEDGSVYAIHRELPKN